MKKQAHSAHLTGELTDDQQNNNLPEAPTPPRADSRIQGQAGWSSLHLYCFLQLIYRDWHTVSTENT